MFATFVGTFQSASASALTHPLPAKPRRRQVSKACDWCRVHRIKCDTSYPCRNCLGRGGRCSNKGDSEIRTLPHAVKEIERLRLRIKELEDQLGENGETCDGNCESRFVKQRGAGTSQHVLLDPMSGHRTGWKYWDGVLARTAYSHRTQWYGPASSFYFIARMSSYLGTVFQQPQPDEQMQPNSASRSFATPVTVKMEGSEEPFGHMGTTQSEAHLTRDQEDYFISLYWQSYHCTYPILEENEFQIYRELLWDVPGPIRKPSALVDIVTALCMQHAVAFRPRNSVKAEAKSDFDTDDATIAGLWHFRRCQSLLSSELESPSLATLQCHIFLVVYLCNASFQNMAHSTLALAIRTAHILGLHLEPPEDLPLHQRELRKRLWWTLYTVDSKTCMKLGRPFGSRPSQVVCSLPSDEQGLDLPSRTIFAASSPEYINSLTYNIQSTKLILAARAIYIAYYDKVGQVLGVNDSKSLYTNPQAFETCASQLNAFMKTLHHWRDQVPEGLTFKRETGSSFSTGQARLVIDHNAPLWLQRQTSLLELLYHNLSMNFYRPFISFHPDPSPPTANANATFCAQHAMEITSIMHQILHETDALSGWYEAYLWQWNATLSLIGFTLAYPASSIAPAVRHSIDLAVDVFENFGQNVAVAASAAMVTRNLIAKVDFLLQRQHGGVGDLDVAAEGVVSGDDPLLMSPMDNGVHHVLLFDETSAMLFEDLPADFQNAFADDMGLAFNVDSSNGLEPLSEEYNDLFDSWTFTQ